MKITQEEVTHVANLSKLKFSPEETAEFATTLSKIVDMVELLEEVDTTGAELGPDGPATGHPVPGQVQDLGLTTSFVWSSLTILIT